MRRRRKRRRNVAGSNPYRWWAHSFYML